jgi:hypothetical protein
VSDSTSPDAVARSMGLGGDLPPAPAAEAVSVTARPVEPSGLEVPGRVAAWRRGWRRALIVTLVLCFSGYVFAWGDVEEESRIVAALAGGWVFALITFSIGLVWWIVRLLIGRPRPFGRTVFNYGLVGAIAVIAILGADELLG